MTDKTTEELGYEPGQHFLVVSTEHKTGQCWFKKGAVIELISDYTSDVALFKLISGDADTHLNDNQGYISVLNIQPYPSKYEVLKKGGISVDNYIVVHEESNNPLNNKCYNLNHAIKWRDSQLAKGIPCHIRRAHIVLGEPYD